MSISAQLNVENFETMRLQEPRDFQWLRIDPNYNCNVHCAYCHSNRSKELISLKQIEQFLAENVRSLQNVQYGCVMEPTMDPRLAQFMQTVQNASNATNTAAGDVVLQTNGILLHTHDADLVREAGLTHLSVSIDSTNPETLADLRGGSSFRKVSSNVVEFMKSCPDVVLQILTTVTTANINQLEQLLDWGLGIGAERFVLREVFYYPDNPIVDHDRIQPLLLAPGQYAEMQQRIDAKYGSQAAIHFAPSEKLQQHLEKVHKQSYQIGDSNSEPSEEDDSIT